MIALLLDGLRDLLLNFLSTEGLLIRNDFFIFKHFFNGFLTTIRRYYCSMTSSATLINAMFQSTLTGVGLLDDKNKFVEVNDSFCRIYGYTREELIGQPLSMISPTDFRERANLLYQDYVKGNTDKGVKHIRRKDGSSAIVHITTENVKEESGEYKLMQVVDLPENTSGLLEKKVTYPPKGPDIKPVAENINSALLRCNSEGKINFANDAARALLFLPQGYQVLNIQAYIFSGNISRPLSLIQLLNEKTSFDNMEVLIDRADESQLWILLSAKPIVIDGALHYDISVVNIDALKKLEQKLLSRIEQLKNTNKQLDHFVYSATHDLKAPLASLSGLISIFRYEDDAAQQELYLQLMEKSIHRLNEFIKEIVDYSRNSNQELKVEKIDFNELVNEIFEGLEHMSEAATTQKIIDIDQSSLFFSDRHRLKVVLSNLITNAYKYGSSHRRDSFVHIHVQADSQQASIHVKDNGQGISQEHIDRIFDMFFRASEGKGGSGLGLYIVKETIEKMQGNIHVVSEVGKGTCFIVTIPSQVNSGNTSQMALDI